MQTDQDRLKSELDHAEGKVLALQSNNEVIHGKLNDTTIEVNRYCDAHTNLRLDNEAREDISYKRGEATTIEKLSEVMENGQDKYFSRGWKATVVHPGEDPLLHPVEGADGPFSNSNGETDVDEDDRTDGPMKTENLWEYQDTGPLDTQSTDDPIDQSNNSSKADPVALGGTKALPIRPLLKSSLKLK